VISVSRVDVRAYDAARAGSAASLIAEVVEEARTADARSPLNEATLLGLRAETADEYTVWVAQETPADPPADPPLGVALLRRPGTAARQSRPEPAEANVVVAPSARGRGVGRALAEALLEEAAGDEVTAWSHGNHPAARRLAASLGLERERDLWVMRRPLSEPLPPADPAAAGVVVRPFRLGEDEDAWLALNAEAFAGHPEQGAMTRTDLEARTAEPWFDPEGFFVAEPADVPGFAQANEMVESPSLLGFHWTKVHDDRHGEVYVLGVSPAAQGMGLGRVLTLTGLHHLAGRGLEEVILYVEADNAPAIAVYEGLGFTHADTDTDVMYRRPAGAATAARR
jgi:mycothiol synthase